MRCSTVFSSLPCSTGPGNNAMEIKDYFDEVPVDTIKSRFATKLEILKNGICRNGSEGRAGNS